MLNHRIIRKIGNSSWTLAACLVQMVAFAGETKFSAQVDRRSISLDESVSLKLSIKSDSNGMMGEPEMKAPDFEVINQFSSISVSTQYDFQAGRSIINQKQITKVLKPLKAGILKISNIQLYVGGKLLKADDISVQVAQAGSPSRSTPPLGQAPLRFKDKAPNGTQIFVRAEVSKEKVYKGEQVIVSYYLYHPGKVFNIQIDNFPVLSGFLREDLEMPVMSQRLETEDVQLNGKFYQRSLLARYAAYPLQGGQLSIDSMALKYNYYLNSRGGEIDEEDPFFGFFQQLTPRVGSSKSEQLTVEVIPLPEQGRPPTFAGGIGDFSVTSAVDKYEVRANEAVTLTVKVEGHGNIATIQEPKSKWPDNVELYDTQGKTQAGTGGSGAKIFEFLLIPREPGKVNLPPIEFSFFDPVKKTYYTKSTEPLQLTVQNPAPGSALMASGRNHSNEKSATELPKESSPGVDRKSKDTEVQDLRYLKTPTDFAKGLSWLPNWKFLYGCCFLAFIFFLGLVSSDHFRLSRRSKKNKNASKIRGNPQNWEKLHFIAREATAGASWQQVSHAYEMLTAEIFEGLEKAFGLEVRSLSRFELRRSLVEERELQPFTWDRIVKLLEFADLIRFASSAGGTSESTARAELSKWVQEGEAILSNLESQTQRHTTSP